jgi:hypothetical protein
MRLQIQLSNVFKRVKNSLFLIFLFVGVSSHLNAQTTFKINGLADVEISKGGSSSHYYYNEIDQNHTDLRIGIAQLNLVGQINFGKQWIFNTRLLLERDKGQKFENFVIPQLNIQWLSKDRKVGLTIGSFTNPFGSFNKKQLSIDRNFIGLPLAYSFHNNISDKIGFLEGMGDIEKINIDGSIQWGTSNIYYGGYTTGAMFSWNIKPSKVNWKVALVSGASNLQKHFTSPLNFGVISRLKIQPTYFWEQGISISHGTFFQESEVSPQLTDLKDFTQTIIGLDYKLGFGFFEFSGEVMGVFYKVPEFNGEDYLFVTGSDTRNLNNIAAYLDIKYEPPVLQGSYIVYRIDHLDFGKLDDDNDPTWDNKVLRHSIAIGYHINQHILARISVSTQQVDNKNWDKTQRTLRVVLTAHY